MKKTLVFVISLVICSMCFSQAQADEKYMDKLQEMFEVSGSITSYISIVDQMFKMIEAQASELEKSNIALIKEEIKKTSLDELLTMLAPIYVKYLSIDDIDGMIAFYKTPVGQKYAAVTPQITAESVAVGQQWGMQLAQKIQAKMTN